MAKRCSGSASSPGSTAAPASGACSTTPARTASRRSRRTASTTRAASSACTTAGASTAPAPASSFPRPPPSALRCIRTARRAWRLTPAWCRTESCGSTRGPIPSTRTCCRGSGRRTSRRSTTRPSSPRTASGISSMVEHDQEGGGPIKLKIEEASINGFLSAMERGYWKFIAPCTFYSSGTSPAANKGNKKTPRFMLVVFCVPVAPGRSRLIWAFPRNFGVWLDKIIPRWFYHIVQNRVLDSDAYLLHVEEHRFAAAGLDNWQNKCYVPASSDTMVIAFRNWFKKFCKNQVGWATPQADQLPPTPTKDQLMERYWSHVVQCTSCSPALKTMKVLEVALQVTSVSIVGFLAVVKGTLVTSAVQRTAVVSAAMLCFAASRWLANFIDKNFYFQDYSHAYK